MSYTKEQLEEAFKKFDVNGDGTAEKGEILSVLESVCGFGHDEAVGILHTFLKEQNLDPDGDGRVTFTEFSNAVLAAKK